MKAKTKATIKRLPNQCHPQKGVGMVLTEILKRQLADVSHNLGVALRAPLDDMIDWILNEGPRLDRHLLQWLENNPSLDGTFEKETNPLGGETRAALFEPFPEWLKPLVEEAYLDVVNDIKPFPALYSLRQVLVFGYKYEQPLDPDKVRDSVLEFFDIDESCQAWEDYYSSPQCNRVLLDEARKIVSQVTARCDFRNIVGRHGPGSVFPSATPAEKTKFLTYIDSIERYYGHSEHFCALPSFWKDVMCHGDSDMDRVDDIVAKITAVPKDSRGPRLICVHPKEAIWIQLGQSDVLTKAICNHPLTRGKVNFTDQTVNADLALLSSENRAYCTIDLKEASDRVSCSLVRHLFGDFQYEILSCTRASHVVWNGSAPRALKKWAPMGNGLTFPVESLVFYALVVAGIRLARGHRYGVPDAPVYVFGDDLVVPIKERDVAIKALVQGGLVPNPLKTFSKGFFRESCGTDAYKGIRITPIRARKGLELKTTAQGVSVCDLAKRLRLNGRWHRTASYLYDLVARKFGKLPISNNPDYTGLYEYRDVTLVQLLSHMDGAEFPRGAQTSSLASMKRGDGIWQKLWVAGKPRGYPTPRVVDLCTKWHKDLQVYGITVRSVRRVNEHVPNDGWYHLQDSLMRLHPSRVEALEYQERWTGLLAGDLPIAKGISERGLAYPHPERVRTYKGFVPHLPK